MLPSGTNATAKRIRSFLDRHRDEMVAFLTRLVECESPTDEPQSQGAVLDLVSTFLERIEYRVRRVGGIRTGGVLLAHPASQPGPEFGQLLVGHCDTVWPMGTKIKMPVELSGELLRGPGVFDMKSGLAQELYALLALHELGLTPPVPPVVFVNTDEEIGSPESRELLIDLAKSARRAFVLEPALGPMGKLKTVRKGVGRFVVEVSGKAAHAGLDPGAGASAIAELALLIQQLFALNAPDIWTTVNVGTIEGGVRPNVVAAHSRAVVDVRVLTQEEGERVSAAIHGLRPTTPDTTIRVRGGIDRPPLEATARNERLWQQAKSCGQVLGIDLEEATAGGGSDGNHTSQHTATLDGLGGVGDGAHAPHEFVRTDKLTERAALLALLLLSPE